jgi:hypothetical protein
MQQIQKAGEWYGGIKPGDYIFPIYQGKIDRLWQVRESTNRPNNINKDNPEVVEFSRRGKKTSFLCHKGEDTIGRSKNLWANS